MADNSVLPEMTKDSEDMGSSSPGYKSSKGAGMASGAKKKKKKKMVEVGSYMKKKRSGYERMLKESQKY